MSAIDNYFNKIFVINLDESVDRWKSVVDELQKAGITNYERVPGVRLKSLAGIPESYYNRLVSQHKVHDYYKIGAVGGNMAHNNCIKLAKERGYNNVLILEDDIGIRENANELFEKIIIQLKNISWDVLYLGGSNQTDKTPIKISENLVKADKILACHSYAVRSHLFNKIITESLSHGKELDNYYKDLQPSHKCICTSPKLTWQKDGVSIVLQRFTDIEKYTRD